MTPEEKAINALKTALTIDELLNLRDYGEPWDIFNSAYYEKKEQEDK